MVIQNSRYAHTWLFTWISRRKRYLQIDWTLLAKSLDLITNNFKFLTIVLNIVEKKVEQNVMSTSKNVNLFRFPTNWLDFVWLSILTIEIVFFFSFSLIIKYIVETLFSPHE